MPSGFFAGILFIVLARPSKTSLLLGSLIILAGEAVRIIASGTLVKAKELTMHGIYARIRHPLYLGSFFLGLGVSVISRSSTFAAIFLTGFFFVYIRVIRREEKFLETTYGDIFRNYKAGVPGLIVKISNNSGIFEGFSFQRAIKNREHHTVIGIVVLIMIALVKMILLRSFW